MRATGIQKNREGFTLTETAIAVGVIAMVLGGIWTVGNLVRRNKATQDAVIQLETIKKNIIDMQAGYSIKQADGTDYATGADVTSAFISRGAISAEYINPKRTNEALTPWATPFQVYVDSSSVLRFRIVVSRIPSVDACQALVMNAINCEAALSSDGSVTAQMGCPLSMDINNVRVLPEEAPEGWKMTPLKAMEYCRSSTPRSLAFVFAY